MLGITLGAFFSTHCAQLYQTTRYMPCWHLWVGYDYQPGQNSGRDHVAPTHASLLLISLNRMVRYLISERWQTAVTPCW